MVTKRLPASDAAASRSALTWIRKPSAACSSLLSWDAPALVCMLVHVRNRCQQLFQPAEICQSLRLDTCSNELMVRTTGASAELSTVSTSSPADPVRVDLRPGAAFCSARRGAAGCLPAGIAALAAASCISTRCGVEAYSSGSSVAGLCTITEDSARGAPLR